MSSTYGSLADSANGLTPFAGDELRAYELPAPVRHAAALVICDNATDVTDARQLLEACGLAAYQHGKFISYAFGRSTRS